MNLDRSRDLRARTDWSDCTGKSINKTSVYTFTRVNFQADLPKEDIEVLENMRPSKKAGNSVLSKSSFEADEERVKFYTRLTAMSIMLAVFDLINPSLSERKSITKFQKPLLTFMRLRLNLSVQAYRLGVHVFTLSRVFRTWTQIMFTFMAFLVKW